MVIAMPTLAVLAFISPWQLLGELNQAQRPCAALRGCQVALALTAMLVLPTPGCVARLPPASATTAR